MPKTYVLIEMADVELLGITLFPDEAAANAKFEIFCEQNGVREYDKSELTKEIPGTLRLAGDDAYSLQLLEVEPIA